RRSTFVDVTGSDVFTTIRHHVNLACRGGGRLSHLAPRVVGMSVRRVMGTEVEYGVSVPGQPGANPMVTSSQVVNAYGAAPPLTSGRPARRGCCEEGARARWTYEEESPLRDARGFSSSGALYDPAEALADEDLGLANVILTNGARLYLDHAHPEHSTTNVTHPRDA